MLATKSRTVPVACCALLVATLAARAGRTSDAGAVDGGHGGSGQAERQGYLAARDEARDARFLKEIAAHFEGWGYDKRRCQLIAFFPRPAGQKRSEIPSAVAVFITELAGKSSIVVSIDMSSSGILKLLQPIDATSVDVLAKACADVLSRHSDGGPGDAKNTRYFASHWTPGGTLQGVTGPVRPGTVADDFVAFEALLLEYSRASVPVKSSKELDQGHRRSTLVAAAKRLSARIAAVP